MEDIIMNKKNIETFEELINQANYSFIRKFICDSDAKYHGDRNHQGGF